MKADNFASLEYRYAFARAVRVTRASLEMTQEDFAKRFNSTQAAVAQYENGARAMSLETFITFCDGLKIDPVAFINEIKTNYPMNTRGV